MKEYKLPGTGEPVALIEGVAEHRLLTVMKALFWGVEVTIENLSFRLAEAATGGILPVMLLGEKNDVVMGAPDLTIGTLSDMVAGMPEKDFEALKFALSASRAITLCRQNPDRHVSKQRANQ